MADRVGPFDLVLYNAGMDPSDSGVSESQLGQRERMVAQWAGEHDRRLVYALAGGYTSGMTMDQLVGLHLLTVSAFG
jgi:acetoin utilization deacetylase AcuC-like enzyme